jgi:signal peptidase I
MAALVRVLKYGGLAAFGLLSLAMLAVSLPNGGWRALSVQTGSMRPGIDPGELVLVQRVDAGQLMVGDVVTYGVPGQRHTVTHRIVKVKDEAGQQRQFMLQGDANAVPDPLISGRHIIGKVIGSVPLAGKLTDVLRTPVGLILLVYIPALSVVWGELKRLSLYYKSLQPKTLPRRKMLIMRPNMLMAMVVALSLTRALPAWAAMQAEARLTGNTITAAFIPPPGRCNSSNTSIKIDTNSSQTSTTGDATNSNNTNGGSSTSGNASNSNNSSINIDVC